MKTYQKFIFVILLLTLMMSVSPVFGATSCQDIKRTYETEYQYEKQDKASLYWTELYFDRGIISDTKFLLDGATLSNNARVHHVNYIVAKKAYTAMKCNLTLYTYR